MISIETRRQQLLARRSELTERLVKIDAELDVLAKEIVEMLQAVEG